MTEEEIIQYFPELSKEAIKACLAFAAQKEEFFARKEICLEINS